MSLSVTPNKEDDYVLKTWPQLLDEVPDSSFKKRVVTPFFQYMERKYQDPFNRMSMQLIEIAVFEAIRAHLESNNTADFRLMRKLKLGIRNNCQKQSLLMNSKIPIIHFVFLTNCPIQSISVTSLIEKPVRTEVMVVPKSPLDMYSWIALTHKISRIYYEHIQESVREESWKKIKQVLNEQKLFPQFLCYCKQHWHEILAEFLAFLHLGSLVKSYPIFIYLFQARVLPKGFSAMIAESICQSFYGLDQQIPLMEMELDGHKYSYEWMASAMQEVMHVLCTATFLSLENQTFPSLFWKEDQSGELEELKEKFLTTPVCLQRKYSRESILMASHELIQKHPDKTMRIYLKMIALMDLAHI